jgi:hypothetical protein
MTMFEKWIIFFFNHPTSMCIRDVQNKHTEDDYHQFIWLSSTSTDIYPYDSLTEYCNSLPKSSTANIITTNHTFRTPKIWKSHKLSHCHQRRICLSCCKCSGLELFFYSRFQTFSIHNQFILNVVHRGIKM